MRDATRRITVSLPGDLLEAVEEKVAKEGEGHSALVRRLFETALRDAEERQKVEQYIRGYRERPATEDEVGWSDQAAREGLSEAAWK